MTKNKKRKAFTPRTPAEQLAQATRRVSAVLAELRAHCARPAAGPLCQAAQRLLDTGVFEQQIQKLSGLPDRLQVRPEQHPRFDETLRTFDATLKELGDARTDLFARAHLLALASSNLLARLNEHGLVQR